MSATTTPTTAEWSPRQVTLRDGRTVTLRPPRESDAQGMIDYLDDLRRTALGILFSVHDDLPTLEQEIEFIRESCKPGGFNIVTEADGMIASICSVRPTSKWKTSHVASLGIGIREPWRGVGLGRILMEQMIDFCRRSDRIEKIELSVSSNNPNAEALYISCGFVEEGRRKRQFRRVDGAFDDEILMGLWLGDDEPQEATVS